jgi:ketosteroid isomerase-like protein
MSQENVEAAQRAFDAFNRGDIEAVLQELDPEVEWHSGVLVPFEGEGKIYRGHEGYRDLWRDLHGAFAEFHLQYSEIRDLGDRIVAIGRAHTRGMKSGVETESPICWVVDMKNGKASRVLTYLDPKEALEAAGLRG